MVQIAKKGIRKRFSRLILNFVQAIGYFFGFSLVAVFSFGLLHSEEFETLTGEFHSTSRLPVFEKHGKYYLRAKWVALVGWIFASFVIYLLTL